MLMAATYLTLPVSAVLATRGCKRKECIEIKQWMPTFVAAVELSQRASFTDNGTYGNNQA